MSSRPSTARTQHSLPTDDRPLSRSPSLSDSSPFDDDDDDDDDMPPPHAGGRISSPEAHGDNPRPSSASGTLRVLARGNACLCCRRRKLKCDGAKPHCGPCTRGRRMNECVYEEAKIKTKTQILQSRIRELEAKMKRMAEREKNLEAAAARAGTSPPPSERRQTLPIALQPPSLHHHPLRSDSASTSTSSATFASGSAFAVGGGGDFAFTDPMLATLAWSATTAGLDQPALDFGGNGGGFGQSELLQNVSAALQPHADSWTTPTQAPPSFTSSSWMDMLPGPTSSSSDVVPSIFTSTSTPEPKSSSLTVAPSSLTPYVSPPSTSTSKFSSSPSLSNTLTSSTSASSPPTTTWEDDIRLSALDLTRPMGDNDDVPPEIGRELIEVFLRHRRQCMFEVHVDRFLASINNSNGTGARPHPALLNAIYLLGCHFSPNSHLSQYESLFLARTRKGINHSLENADRLLNFLQASCLLAYYFFFKGRLLEGHYHASAAARFAMSCGLHLLKVKADGVQGTLTFYYPSSSSAPSVEKSILPQPEDSIALAERINLFWSIFAADRTGSVGTGLPIVIRDDEIETPWPRRFEDFELNDLVRFDSSTLRSLYVPGNTGAYVRASDSAHAIKCKALALNERASRLASLLESDPGAVNDTAFWPTFDAIDGAITQFLGSLPSVDCEAFVTEEEIPPSKITPVSPSLVLAHTAAHGAAIQLHRMFSQNDAGSYKRCLAAAKAAIKVLKDGVVGRADWVDGLPMQLGIIWTSIAEALAAEYERLGRLGGSTAEVCDELTLLFTAMKDLRNVFPILTLRINKVPLFQGCLLEQQNQQPAQEVVCPYPIV